MNRRRLLAIGSIVMIAVFAVGMTLFLRGQEAYEPPRPSDGLDLQRSQVYLSGTGYQLDKEQKNRNREAEKKKEEQKKDTEKQQEIKPPQKTEMTPVQRLIRENRSAVKSDSSNGKGKAKKGNPADPSDRKDVRADDRGGKTTDSRARKKTSARKPEESSGGGNGGSSGGGNGSGGGGPSNDSVNEEDPSDPTDPSEAPGGGEESGLTEEEIAKKPRIAISIASGQRIGGKHGNFTVRVTDYKGRNVPVFSEDDGYFAAFFNGEQLVSTGRSGNETAFRAELAEGTNEIHVSAVDREGNTNERKVRFTGDTSVESEVIGEVYVAIEANILNLGTIYDAVIDIHPGDSAKDVLQEAFKQAGITPYFSGSYLGGIGRSGIAEGAFIDEDTRAHMEELRKTEKDPDKQDKNKIKEHDFYDSSGWIYSVNGEFPEMGLGSYRMEDGDELCLIFQLATDVY